MNEEKYKIKCIDCGFICNDEFLISCPKCGGMVDIIYNFDRVKINNSKNPNIKYFDFLPIKDKNNLVEVTNIITPLVHARNIGKKIGFNNLFLKNETIHPTKTTKDRMASVALSYFKELGVEEFVIASTGNSAISYIKGASLTKAKIHVFLGKIFFEQLNIKESENIIIHVVDNDFVEAGKEAKKFAQENNLVFEGGAFNPARREGLKLTYLEAFDQLKSRPDYIFQAVSSGMGIMGAYKGVKEDLQIGKLKKMPKIVCCQQESCNPMIRAWKDNSPIIKEKYIITNPKGLARAILRGDPTKTYPYLYKIVTESEGCFIDANNEEIMEAIELAKLENLNICFAAAVALASAVKMIKNKKIESHEKILVNITGGERAGFL